MNKFIWCLFRIENEYNQPPNCLIANKKKKPTLEQLSKILKIDFKSSREEDIVACCKIWSDEISHEIGGDSYWLEKMEENKAYVQ